MDTVLEGMKGTSATIDECFDSHPGPLAVARCLGRQWRQRPVQTTCTFLFAAALVTLGTIYMPIKLMARRSRNRFVQKYIA